MKHVSSQWSIGSVLCRVAGSKAPTPEHDKCHSCIWLVAYQPPFSDSLQRKRREQKWQCGELCWVTAFWSSPHLLCSFIFSLGEEWGKPIDLKDRAGPILCGDRSKQLSIIHNISPLFAQVAQSNAYLPAFIITTGSKQPLLAFHPHNGDITAWLGPCNKLWELAGIWTIFSLVYMSN